MVRARHELRSVRLVALAGVLAIGILAIACSDSGVSGTGDDVETSDDETSDNETSDNETSDNVGTDAAGPADAAGPEDTGSPSDTTATDTAPAATSDAPTATDPVVDADGQADSSLTEDTPSPDALEPGEDAGGTEPDAEQEKTKVVLTCTEDIQCNADCALGGACVDGKCEWALVAGCMIVDETNKFATCYGPLEKADDSDCVMCNPFVDTTRFTGAVIHEGFENGFNQAFSHSEVFEGQQAVWHVTQDRQALGDSSFRFGVPGAGHYDEGGRVWARASTFTINPDEDLALEFGFMLWLETEETPGFDLFRLIHTIDGVESVLWDSDSIAGTTGGEFMPVSTPLTLWAGKENTLSFEFDTVDDLINEFEGPFVDAVTASNGCCVEDIDCLDSDPCTVEVCGANGKCLLGPVPDCCSTAADCDDGDVCTVDFCNIDEGGCDALPIDGCCHSDLDCNDDNPCTEDICPGDGDSCQHKPLCCEADFECEDGDKCTDTACVEGQCHFTFVCCLDDVECNDGDACTHNQCIDGDCTTQNLTLPGCCVPVTFDEPFDGGDPGTWTFDPASGGVGWQFTSLSENQSAPGVLYYGNPANQDFDSGGSPNSGTAISPPISLPLDVDATLTFDILIEGEFSNFYDQFTLSIVSIGAPVQLVTKSDLTNGQWVKITRDLSSLAGTQIQFYFYFDTIDGLSNDGIGCVIDNFQITTSCEPRVCAANNQCPSQDPCIAGACQANQCAYTSSCCQSDSECDDSDVCTSDSCVGGKCQFNGTPGCCESANDCDDLNACTLDLCSGFGGQCSHQDISGCCLNSAACDDEEPCTLDLCLENICAHTNVCCTSDAECDDGDDICTIDDCVDGFCIFQQTGIEGCCVAEPLDWTFETPTFELSTSASSPPCQWQVQSGQKAQSGTSALYYGNPNSQNFDCDANSGSATTGDITLLPNVAYELTFWVYLDTELSTSFDMFWVNAEVDGKTLGLWDKGSLNSTSQWQEVTVNISAFAGKTFKLRFDFDSMDSIANSGEGVFVDDVKISSPCALLACTGDSECSDGLNGTSSFCSVTGCVYSID